VSPALVIALHDLQPEVRLLAAAALLKIDTQAVLDADVDEVLVGILNDPDPQVAHRAAGYLPELQTTSGLVVPALIDALNSTNTLVACSSVWALKRITNSSELILPALQMAATREDNAGGWARKALNELQSSGQDLMEEGADD